MLAIPTRFHDVDAVRARYGDETVDQILRTVTLTDEPADRLVAAFHALPGGAGWAMLDQAIALGPDAVPDAPPELDELLAPLLDPPAWVDFDLIDAGAVALWRVGALPQILSLTAGSLAYGYGSAGFARPLVRTGRLTQRAPRRLGETARWELLATQPGALRPGAAGLHATVRLRLVHALVRAHLRRDGDWDSFNWGEPISVADTLATGVIGHFVYPLRGLQDIGVRQTPAELEAITHLWTWVSFVLGVPEEYLPRSYAEAVNYADAAMALDSGGIPESRELVHALLFDSLAFGRVMPGPAAAVARLATGHVLGAVSRRWLGGERADELGVPNTPLKHLVPALRPLVRARDIARATGLLGSDERLTQIEIAVAQRLLSATGTATAPIQPEHIEREPVLAAA